MDSNSVLETLSNIPVGTVIGLIAAIAAAVGGICTGTIKLYKVFTKYKSLKDENEEQKNMLKEHDRILDEINQKLDKVCSSLDEQKEVNLKQIRHTIVHTCDDAIAQGEISASKLKSLEEMYQEYVDIFHGNGYVKTLMIKTRKLPITGKLDD